MSHFLVIVPFFQSYDRRIAQCVHPVSKRLLEIMKNKETNLCYSVDVDTCQELLKV